MLKPRFTPEIKFPKRCTFIKVVKTISKNIFTPILFFSGKNQILNFNYAQDNYLIFSKIHGSYETYGKLLTKLRKSFFYE